MLHEEAGREAWGVGACCGSTRHAVTMEVVGSGVTVEGSKDVCCFCLWGNSIDLSSHCGPMK